jgi:regulator of replication initiation timing
MGTFAKIFIVVNLVLAVVFLGAAAALLGTAESWKKKYESDGYMDVMALNKSVKDRLGALDAQLKVATDERDKYQSDFMVEQRRATELDKKLVEKNTEFSQIVGKYNNLAEDFNALTKSFDDMKANYKEAFDENRKLQGQVDTALAETAAAKQDADDLRETLEREQGIVKQLQADLGAAEKSNMKITEEKNRLADVVAMINEKAPDLLKDLMVLKAVKATVVGVDADLNIVLISAGADDEVQIGYTFTVYRGGQYVGKLVIDKVGPDWASGHMDTGLTKEFPQRGDEAATQL